MKHLALAPLLLAPIYFLLAPRLISWRQRRAADTEGTVVGTSPTARRGGQHIGDRPAYEDDKLGRQAHA